MHDLCSILLHDDLLIERENAFRHGVSYTFFSNSFRTSTSFPIIPRRCSHLLYTLSFVFVYSCMNRGRYGAILHFSRHSIVKLWQSFRLCMSKSDVCTSSYGSLFCLCLDNGGNPSTSSRGRYVSTLKIASGQSLCTISLRGRCFARGS